MNPATPHATQKGLVIGNADVHAVLATDAPNAYKVKDWANGKQPMTSAQACSALIRAGFHLETVFDAAHGRRYVLFAYCTPQGRVGCWDCYAPNR